MINVIGAGLAGCEAAWQIAKQGISVNLIEMKPLKLSEAHTSEYFAEVVCSNSFKSKDLTNACGLLKEELRVMGSLLMECAEASEVPAGGALAVDRDLFSKIVTGKIKSNPFINVTHEVCESFSGITVIATGPLTDSALIPRIRELCGEALHFYDASAPIVTKESIDMDYAFYLNRYGKGSPDYINCPLDREEYMAFYEALIGAKRVLPHEFEKADVFEGCVPLEVLAARGIDTLRFGNLKPVGLYGDMSRKKPYAVAQLRRENTADDLYGMVGFQTNLTFGEQKRVFSLIPALRNAEFSRYGVMHKNMFINSPSVLNTFYQHKNNSGVFFAGQITGVEGYVESIASGMSAGINAARIFQGKDALEFPRETVIGALASYIAHADSSVFQPMNACFGIMKPIIDPPRNKQLKKTAYAERAISEINAFKAKNDL